MRTTFFLSLLVIGLGLPLAKAMMELHGGSLAILSAPHKGTAVLLTFPAQRVRPGADRTQQVAKSSIAW